jgi:hypothetical protein
MMARASGGSGTTCALLFLVRDDGMVQVAPSSLNSARVGGKCALTNPTFGSAGCCARGERADVADSVVTIAAPL